MGSQAIQGKLWGQRPQDWAGIQEQTGAAGYTFALSKLKLTSADEVLDIGCGSGLFCQLADGEGARVTGIDASEELISEAEKRAPTILFSVDEMENLPFASGTFTVVTGFNSFQYAANVPNAIAEAKRVMKDNGRLVAMIWGNKEACEAATYLKAVGSLLPPPPPGAAGPFALSENQLLETIITESGLTITTNEDIDAVWDYPDKETALKGLIAAGPVAKAIEHSGYQKVYDTVAEAVQPYIQPNGHVVYHNKFRIVIAVK